MHSNICMRYHECWDQWPDGTWSTNYCFNLRRVELAFCRLQRKVDRGPITEALEKQYAEIIQNLLNKRAVSHTAGSVSPDSALGSEVGPHSDIVCDMHGVDFKIVHCSQHTILY